MFGYNLNVRPSGHQQGFIPPPRFQGHSMQPWPEMGNFGVNRGAMVSCQIEVKTRLFPLLFTLYLI